MKEVKRYIKALKIGGYSQEETQKLVEILIQNNGYKVDAMQALLQLETIYRAGRDKSLSQEINDFVANSQKWWDIKSIDTELHIATDGDKKIRRVVLHNLVSAGILEHHPTRNGVYRRVEIESNVIDWKEANPANVMDLRFPFGLEKYVTIYPRNIAVVAGSKSEGKTAFANNFILLNQNNDKLPQPIYLFTSEGAEEEMNQRFTNFGIPLEEWVFEARSRTSNFGDAIVKDHINVIDYLEIRGGEYYLVRDEIAKIYDNLGKGFCLICLQKPPGRDLGIGGYASIEKSRLYIAMEKQTLTIVDAKNYKGKINPRGWKWRFKVDEGGSYFKDIQQLETE
jgi:hypothetical protein